MNQNYNLWTDLEKALGSLTHEDYIEILSEMDNVAWIEHNRILKGKPFSFDGRDYLLQPYRDEYQDLIFYKGRQVEMSEFTMNWMFRNLYKYPYTAGLHTFPRDHQCIKFSKQRLDPSIKDSERLENWYRERESEMKMRKFVRVIEGERLQPYNFYILGGTWESRKDTVGDAARGLTIDFIAYDERQDHPDDVETVVGEAASHSEYKRTITLGTPKLPGTQFDRQWESSDKHLWNVTCEHCNWSDPITMDNILDSGDDEFYYGCPRCKKPINRLNGKWIATNPQRKPHYRGYHINQLMVAWLSAEEIMKKWNSPTYPKRRFYNEVLGLSYGGDDVPITLPMMYACAENNYKLGEVDGNLYVGVDWGNTSWAVIQGKTEMGHKLTEVIVVDDNDPREHPRKIALALKRYVPHVKRVVCDAGPDITRYYSLRDECKSLGVTRDVWACYYSSPPVKKVINWNEEERNVTVGRTEFIDMIIDEISDQYFIIPGYDKELERVATLMDHHTNIAAEKTKGSNGMEYMIYFDTGPDHLLHAKLYSNVAAYEGTAVSIGNVARPFNKPRDISINKTGSGLILPNKSRATSTLFPVFNKRRR